MRREKMRRLLEETKQLKNQSLSKVLLKIFALVLCFSIVLFNIPLTEQNIASSANNSYEEKMPETVFFSKNDVTDLKNRYPNGLLSTGTNQDKKVRIGFGYRQFPVRYMKNYSEEKTVERNQIMNWLLAGATRPGGVLLYAEEPILGMGGDYLFQTSMADQTYEGTTVYANHWGASNIRKILMEQVYDGAFFSDGEKRLIVPSIISTYDSKNSGYYNTTDYLYLAGAVTNTPPTMSFGEVNQSIIKVHNSYAAAYAMTRAVASTYNRIYFTHVSEEGSYGWAYSAPAPPNGPSALKMSTQPAIQLNMNNMAFFSQAYAFEPLGSGATVDFNGEFEEIAEDTANLVHFQCDSNMSSWGPEIALGYEYDIRSGTAIFQPRYSSSVFLVIVAIGTDGKAYRFVHRTDNALNIEVGDIPGLPTDGTRFTIAKAWIEKYDASLNTINASEPITIVPAQRADVGNLGEVTCEVGEKVTLDYKIYPTNTTEILETYWTSYNEAVATVDSQGNVTAKSPGTANILIETTINGKRYTAVYAIKVIRKATGITLNKTTTTIAAGKSETLIATVSPSDATDKRVIWHSNDTTVATVDSESGVVTANGVGEATITAILVENQDIRATCKVTVTNPDILATGVSISPSTASIAVGNTKALTATVSPSNTTQSKLVTWSSSDSAIASVSTSGVVTAKKAGDAIITATLRANINLKATCAVTVTQPVTGLTLDKTQLKMVPGISSKLTATVSPSDATNKTVTWEVQSQTGGSSDVVSVDSQGNVTAKKAGTAFVIARAGSYSKTCTVTVVAKSISISPTSVSIEAGSNKQLTATVSPTDVTFEKAITWTSNKSSVATVSSSGLVTAVAPGTAIITAKLTNDNTVTATRTVTVTRAATGVTLNKTTATMAVGG